MKVRVVSGKRGKYLLRWKTTDGKCRERTTKLNARKSNYKDALKLAAKLETELAGDAPPDLMLTTRQRQTCHTTKIDPKAPAALDGKWQTFREYFFTVHLPGLSKSYPATMGPALNRFEAFASPEYLVDASTSMVRRWVADMRKGGSVSTSTIKTYWSHLRAFLSLAKDEGLITSIPKIRLPKLDTTSLAKGRAINGEEFDRFVAAADKIKARVNTEDVKQLIRGLYLGGLRISEAYKLTWDPGEFFVDIDRPKPMFVIETQKNRKRQLLPMDPEYAGHLRNVSARRRHGFVYKLRRHNGDRMKFQHTKNVLRDCGDLANVITGDGKTASAHDLRRSFATKWANRGIPIQLLQQLMRHSEISTTMKYYAELDAENMADQLARYHHESGQKGGQEEKTPQPDDAEEFI